MPGLHIEGYVIVSADGMLANADHVMPIELKFDGDKQFFTAALDRADLIVHGRHSYEDQLNSPLRKRIVLTRKIGAIASDPSNPKATLWNPAGTAFEAACDFASLRLPRGARALPGYLAHVRQQMLPAHGPKAGNPQIPAPADDVSVTRWRR